MPQFHNGMAYGYTCIKKVAPQQKQTKVVFEEATILKQINVANKWFDLAVKINGKQLRHLVPMSQMDKVMFMQNDKVFVNTKAFKG